MPNESLIVPEKETDDKLEKPEPKVLDFYKGASAKAVTTKQAEVLLAPIDPNDVEIKPDGSPYMPQTKYRRKLNEAFGPMGWSLLPTGELSMKGNVLYRKYVLVVGERYVAEAIGSQQYFEQNANMDYADAAEGVKSNALERCCKDLGIASELWDPGYVVKWRQEYAIEVKAPVRGQMKEVWRRKDRPAFKGEGGSIPQPQTYSAPPAPEPAAKESTNPEKQIISEPRRKRMYAIARNAGMNDQQFKDELLRMGFQSSADVTTDVYDDICQYFESFQTKQS